MLDVAIDAAKKGGALALRYFKTQPKVSLFLAGWRHLIFSYL